MNHEKMIDPLNINSDAIVGIDYEYYEVETGKIADKSAIESAIKLGLSIEPKYMAKGTSKLKLRIYHSDSMLSRPQFNTLIALFEQMAGKIKIVNQTQAKTAKNMPYDISTKVSKQLLLESVDVTFPNGKTGTITPKMAKLATLSELIPDEYFKMTASLISLRSYDVKYYAGNKSFKVGCNKISAEELFTYLSNITTAWDELDAQIKTQ